MNKFIALTKIQIKDFLSKYTQSANVKNKWLSLIIILIPVLLIIPAFQIVKRVNEVFLVINQGELTITYMYIGTVMMMFFACIPFIISVFFYSKDLKFLATLPVKADFIVFSKLAAVYIYLFMIGAFFLGTSIIVYILGTGIDIYVIFTGIMAVFMAPILPMILATLIIIPFMSFVGGSKKRNILAIAGNIMLLTGIIFIQLLIAKMEMSPETLNQMLLQEDGILRLIGRSFPPSIWLTKMITGSLIDAALFILLNAGFFYLLKIIARHVYMKGLLAFNEEGSGIKSRGRIYYKKRSKGLQLIKRHIGIILGTPVFLLNSVLIMFLPIIMFFMLSFTGELSNEILSSPYFSSYIVYIYAGIITTPAIVGSLSATVISREGKSFWETRVMPISGKDNIRYRVYSTLIITFFASILLGITAGVYLNINIETALNAFVFCIAATLFLSTVDIFINIERPSLNWLSPTAAVKNNLNVILSLVIRAIVIGGFYLLYRGISDKLSNVILFFSFILFILYIISSYILYKFYPKKFEEIN